MKHGNCESLDTLVIDSRANATEVRRRRKCVKCGKRFSTLEIAIDEIRVARRTTLRKEFREAATDFQNAFNRLVELNAELKKDVKYMSEKKNELELPMWAVVSSRRVEARRLTYREACDEVESCKASGASDLFITTDDAAARMTKSEKVQEATNA